MSDPWIDRLSDYRDHELPPADREACEAHLRDCATCQDALAGIEAVVHAARQLPGTGPDRDLWPAIAERLDAPEMEPVRSRWPSRRVTFSLPQLALAASLLVAVSAGASWLAANRAADAPRSAPVETPIRAVSEPFEAVPAVQPIGFADAQFDAAVSDLERVLVEHRDTLDPRTVRVLERNLQAIDEAIRQARAALDADPANPYLNSHLVDARQRKLDLLRRAALIAEGGD